MNIYEAKFEGFDITQLQEIADLLSEIAYHPERVPALSIDKLTIWLDPTSGDIYARDEDFITATLNGRGEVEQSYYLSGTGVEGFYGDLVDAFKEGYVTQEDDLEELKSIAEQHKDADFVKYVEIAIDYDELLLAAKLGKLRDEEKLTDLRVVAEYRKDKDGVTLVEDALSKCAKTLNAVERDR